MDIGYRLKRISELMEKDANRQMQAIDLTFSQHHIMITLMHSDGYTRTLKELEKHMNLSQATVAGICARLEEKGYVQRWTVPEDRRVKNVTLTKEGLALCEVSRAHIRSMEASFSSIYTAEEKEVFEGLLDRLYDHLLRNDEKESMKGGTL